MTRTVLTARARQLRRRAHRASRRNTIGPPPVQPMRELTDQAIRQQLGDQRNYLGRLRTLVGRTEEQIKRLERRLDRNSA